MESENGGVVAEVTGEKGQEVAATATGEKGQEVTAPAASTGEMTPEERHAQAEARRKAEREEITRAAEEKAQESAKQTINGFVKSLGKVDPYTGKRIETAEELDAYNAAERRKTLEAKLKSGKATMEDYEELISSSKAVKEAKAAKEQYEAAAARLQQQQKDEMISGELRKIQGIDPNVKDAAALMAHPKYSEISKLVREHGHSLSEAFKIATADDRSAQAQERARNSAAAVAGSKAHMVGSSSSGGAADTVSVPADVANAYRAARPGITDAEIKAKYARYMKLKKG